MRWRFGDFRDRIESTSVPQPGRREAKSEAWGPLNPGFRLTAARLLIRSAQKVARARKVVGTWCAEAGRTACAFSADRVVQPFGTVSSLKAHAADGRSQALNPVFPRGVSACCSGSPGVGPADCLRWSRRPPRPPHLRLRHGAGQLLPDGGSGARRGHARPTPA